MKIKTGLKLIPKILNNFPAILKGIVNDVRLSYGSMPGNQQEEIIRRRVICHECPFNSERAEVEPEFEELYGYKYKSDRPDLHCAHCQCNIDWKTAALEEKCGLSYYNDLFPTNKQPLKWEAYKKPETNDTDNRQDESAGTGTNPV